MSPAPSGRRCSSSGIARYGWRDDDAGIRGRGRRRGRTARASGAARSARGPPAHRSMRSSRRTAPACWDCRQTCCWGCSPPRLSCAACRWRCRRATSSRYCTDLGIPPSHGAAMLSVLLGCAFFSRQMWGWISDRIGGLRTILSGSICQIAGDGRVPAGRRTRPGCSPWPPSSALALPAWCQPTCWRCASCSRPPRRPGGYRRCCCSAARAWRRVAGWPVSSTTSSAFMASPSPPAWLFNLGNLAIIGRWFCVSYRFARLPLPPPPDQ